LQQNTVLLALARRGRQLEQCLAPSGIAMNGMRVSGRTKQA
jgi:hypothetical protein